MHIDIALEALRYFDRTELEGLQMHAWYLRDLVNRHARSLPLRKIHLVDMHHQWVRIQLLDDDRDSILVVGPGESELEMLFHNVNNTFVHRLTLSFFLQDRPFPDYLQANVDNLQCHIRTLYLDYSKGGEQYFGAQEIDYALVDFLGVHLKPTVYKMRTCEEFREDYATIFRHGALRGSVRHVVYRLVDIDAPDCIFAALFGVDVVESCAIETNDNPVPWIGKFVETFKTAGRGTDVVRSMTLLCKRRATFPLDLEPLGEPSRSDVAKPHCEFITNWLRERLPFELFATTESLVADLFMFKNAASTKTLELFTWTVEQGYESGETYHVEDRHYAFFLRVVDT